MKKIHDEIYPGMKIHDWKVIDKSSIKGAAHWNCVCICGHRQPVRAAMLKNEASKRCVNCRRRKCSKESEMTGKKFGKWTILTKIKTTKKGYVYLCICECGNKQELLSSSLRNKTRDHKCRTCVNRELNEKYTKKHGMSRTSIYKIWTAMLQRCENQKCSAYKHYGERGIQVCERWHKFENFFEDMGERPQSKTLDRIDNEGNYEPKNCRWISHKENCNNKGYGGLSYTLAYKSWHKMMQDCYKKLSKSYSKYGAKNIKVCIRWQEFKKFYKDMGERRKDQTLLRKDEKKDFTPENCFWGKKIKGTGF